MSTSISNRNAWTPGEVETLEHLANTYRDASGLIQWSKMEEDNPEGLRSLLHDGRTFKHVRQRMARATRKSFSRPRRKLRTKQSNNHKGEEPKDIGRTQSHDTPLATTTPGAGVYHCPCCGASWFMVQQPQVGVANVYEAAARLARKM